MSYHACKVSNPVNPSWILCTVWLVLMKVILQLMHLLVPHYAAKTLVIKVIQNVSAEIQLLNKKRGRLCF